MSRHIFLYTGPPVVSTISAPEPPMGELSPKSRTPIGDREWLRQFPTWGLYRGYSKLHQVGGVRSRSPLALWVVFPRSSTSDCRVGIPFISATDMPFSMASGKLVSPSRNSRSASPSRRASAWSDVPLFSPIWE